MNSLRFLSLCPLCILLSFSADNASLICSTLHHAEALRCDHQQRALYVVLEEYDILLDILVFYGIALTGKLATEKVQWQAWYSWISCKLIRKLGRSWEGNHHSPIFQALHTVVILQVHINASSRSVTILTWLSPSTCTGAVIVPKSKFMIPGE